MPQIRFKPYLAPNVKAFRFHVEGLYFIRFTAKKSGKAMLGKLL